jgi:hypothetical protein
MESFTFTCACCGETIEGLPDLGYASPVYYDSLPATEREERAQLDSDFCVIDDDSRFIRAVCPIPIVGSDEHFGWGVWVSLSEASFARYRDSFGDDDQSKLGDMFGWFSNRLPDYPDTLNLPATVVPQDDNQRPLVWINQDRADHPLYVHQRQGIERDHLGELYARHLCPNADE